ncbi:MAG: response regulator [Saprospiraceae bacterium]
MHKPSTQNILLVEDHIMVRMLAKQFLLKNGFEVDAVENGEKALLLTVEKSYDLILMDLKLPGINGFDTTKIIRALNNNNANIPILALTSSTKDEVQEQMNEVGITDYVGKPFKSEKLLQKIHFYIFKIK